VLFETLFIGLVVALLFVEITDVYPGGIIVPAYFALSLDQPLTVAATLAVAFAALGAYRLLSRHLILFGKRRFVLLLLLGALFSQLMLLFAPRLIPAAVEVHIIGWVIPGLLANNLDKQKAIPTLASLLTVALAVYVIVRILAWAMGA
jgi:poly-gamma-glutamate biosynthesis protein PgsC/CapC